MVPPHSRLVRVRSLTRYDFSASAGTCVRRSIITRRSLCIPKLCWEIVMRLPVVCSRDFVENVSKDCCIPLEAQGWLALGHLPGHFEYVCFKSNAVPIPTASYQYVEPGSLPNNVRSYDVALYIYISADCRSRPRSKWGCVFGQSKDKNLAETFS